MSVKDWRTEHQELIGVLEGQLSKGESCADVIDSFEELMRSVWSFLSRLLGDAGTRAVFVRSVQLASPDAPLLQKVQIREREVDFSELRGHVALEGCAVPDALDTLLHLGVLIFQTLYDLTGDAVTGPLLRHLDEKQETRSVDSEKQQGQDQY